MITLEEQQRLSEREIRVNKLTPELAELRKNAIILSELKVNIPRPYVGVTDFEHIPPAIGEKGIVLSVSAVIFKGPISATFS